MDHSFIVVTCLRAECFRYEVCLQIFFLYYVKDFFFLEFVHGNYHHSQIFLHSCIFGSVFPPHLWRDLLWVKLYHHFILHLKCYAQFKQTIFTFTLVVRIREVKSYCNYQRETMIISWNKFSPIVFCVEEASKNIIHLNNVFCSSVVVFAIKSAKEMLWAPSLVLKIYQTKKVPKLNLPSFLLGLVWRVSFSRGNMFLS